MLADDKSACTSNLVTVKGDLMGYSYTITTHLLNMLKAILLWFFRSCKIMKLLLTGSVNHNCHVTDYGILNIKGQFMGK